MVSLSYEKDESNYLDLNYNNSRCRLGDVFALPPRWDYDYSQGYEEAENIIKANPLKATPL